MSDKDRPYTFTVPTHHGSVPVTGVVWTGKCGRCHKEITPNTFTAALGPPHHILVHYNCWQYYNFNTPFPHGQPLDYIKRQ